MRRIYRRAKPKEEKSFKANLQIKVPEVCLIDADGLNLGVIATNKAMAMAEEAGLDLVEVNPKISPPIVKIIDFGQFKYERDKQLQKQKAKTKKAETKCLRLSVRIGSHDFDFRLLQAKKFLIKGNKLKLELRLRGREKQHPDLAKEVVLRFIAELKKIPDLNIEIEENLTKQGGQFTILLVNKPKK